MAEASLELEELEIVLERGNHGLGFNIRGGVDIPYVQGDSGIFVTKIREDGAAFLDGRLREGDKILEINGFSLDRVTHNEAVQHFVNAGETVTLRVLQGAEEAILQQRRENEESENGPNQSSGSSSNINPSDSSSGLGLATIVGGSLALLAALAAGAYFIHRNMRK